LFGTQGEQIQTKLTIGEPGDKYEQEADRVAAQVVHQINAPVPSQPEQSQSIQREAMPSEDELQMKAITQLQRSEAGMTATPDLETSIQQARGSGQSLADNIRQPMEQAFGADFSGVKVHTDAQSDQLNQSIQAKAFTTGQDVFFRQGAYEPGSRGGQELIAHELTHVVQQNGAVQRQGELEQKELLQAKVEPVEIQGAIGNKAAQYPETTQIFSRSTNVIQRWELNVEERKRLQSAIESSDREKNSYEIDKTQINDILDYLHPFPKNFQYLSNRLERKLPEFDQFFVRVERLKEQAKNSVSALRKLESSLTWYKQSGDGKKLLKLSLQDAQSVKKQEEEKDATLRKEPRDKLTQITPADENFFRRYLKEPKKPRKVYRGDGRGINADSLKNKNFEEVLPGGTPDISFFGVVQHMYTNTAKNGMVSTTGDFNIAHHFATEAHNYGIVYEFQVDNYIDVDDILDKRNFKNRYPGQKEILIPGSIEKNKIVSATLYNKGEEVDTKRG
jgi:hypothetical protein